MARLLAQTLARPTPATGASPVFLLPPIRGIANKVEFIEIDLAADDDAGGAAATAGGGSPAAEVVGIRRLEEAIHGVMVRRASPDWLPFVPNGSFWVPPLRRPHGVAELVGRIAASGVGVSGDVAYAPEPFVHMTEEEELSLSTARGWPSAAYFVEGKSPHSKKRSRKDAAQTDDEES
ncbi:uncharacterized protein LOC100844999 [Brachypodium distachyon]|uniref:Uncharacterized protein n=1 Tax=Brachypodium distachyon TaxID=15368 RepID=A0A0Q3HQC2_BRADI|nr:uncharacterized protein LOC100844999 [Brachypodium distachyon]KQJ95682.1 hypothetical protein BRADI_3g18527v3 [Brachypodium distachyon]KQJ95683.1 hypothetical protein BRADI_3g18527v3 [Brachypodium distachyon]|eukprot:XP_003573578.1 uncharacterized protein LOC100844999 [Brachypodium distachyon]